MKRLYRYVFHSLILLALLVASMLHVMPVHAAGIVVNSSADTIANDGVCTLREAITAANNNTATGGCPAGSGSDTITFANNYTITLGSQLPTVTTTMTITGNGAANTIIKSNGTYRVLEVSATGNLTLGLVTVREGFCFSWLPCGGNGGNIYNDGTLTVTNATLLFGNAEIGAGIFNNGTLTVTNSTFLNNYAEYYAGGIYNGYTANLTVTNSTFSGNEALQNAGGGISNGGTATISNSTFSTNTSWVAGGINNAGTATLTNNTFSGNNADYYGGGINNAGTMTITNSTFFNNHADYYGGGIYNSVTATLKNSILAFSSSGGNCSGTITNGGYNLDSGSTCGWGSVSGSMSNTDPKLGSLANNGGPTQTHVLLTGSPAIDKGTDAGCPSTDQRGAPRPRGAHCDIGSYELTFPATPTFADVPVDYLYYQDIEILYANGLTGGCATSPLKFCPGDLMNRGQAAVFMMRGTYGSSYTPPGNLVYQFNNDDWTPGTWARPWAEAMLSTNLTTGCSSTPLQYCPWVILPREQVVIFGLKMRYGNTYSPPPATGTVFADMTDPNYYATAWAEKAYADGLIALCGADPVTTKPLFCPRVLVTRGLAAYVIVRAKNLSMP